MFELRKKKTKGLYYLFRCKGKDGCQWNGVRYQNTKWCPKCGRLLIKDRTATKAEKE